MGVVHDEYLRTDSASFLFHRQRIASLPAHGTDSASLRLVAARAFPDDLDDPLPAFPQV
jgi:hypothetical protein